MQRQQRIRSARAKRGENKDGTSGTYAGIRVGRPVGGAHDYTQLWLDSLLTK